jgi:tetratricopeptide (TPR) repeat protein
MMDLETLLSSALELGVEGEWEEAAELLRSGLEDFPEEPAVLCWLGAAERELGMDGIAYERFKQCLALQPEDPHILATAGTALATFDDPEAEAALRTAAILAPELPLARWMYGAYLAREGFVTEALAELDAAACSPRTTGSWRWSEAWRWRWRAICRGRSSTSRGRRRRTRRMDGPWSCSG